MTSMEIRVLGPGSIEDYHAHLLRLDIADRRLRFASESDDRGIDGHCLKLLGTQAIVIGAYVEGTLRAAIELVPDRTARRAEAIFTAEAAFSSPGLLRMLMTRLFDEGRRYHLATIALHGFDDDGWLERAAQPAGIEIKAGTPLLVRFEPAGMPPMTAAAPQASAGRYG